MQAPIIPDFTVSGLTARDARTISLSDRNTVLGMLVDDIIATYPLETTLWVPYWDDLYSWIASARGRAVRLNYDARKRLMLPATTVAGDLDHPVVFGVYSSGTLTNAIAWYGIQLQALSGGVRPFTAWPIAGAAAFPGMAGKANFLFSAMEAFFALTISGGANPIKMSAANVWHFDDPARNSVGDQWSRAFLAEGQQRVTRSSQPLLVVSATNNGGLTGRTLYTFRPFGT